MKPLFIITLALIAAAILAALFCRRWSNAPTRGDSASFGEQTEPFTAYGVAMLFAVGVVITAILIPIVALFHSAKEPALVAMLVFFVLPVLAYAFLSRCDYLPREKPTLQPPQRKPARK